MKLVATTTALIAALSLFGCATENDGEGGGHLAGLRPAKPSIEDSTFFAPTLSPAIEKLLNGVITTPRGVDFVSDPEISAETIKPPFSITGICKVCSIVVLEDRRFPGELHVIDEDGNYFCRFKTVKDGSGDELIVHDGCN